MPEKGIHTGAEDRLIRHGVKRNTHFSDLDTGWAWVVLVASFGTSCLLGATQFASGIVQLILLERYQTSLSMTSAVGAVHVSLIGLGGPISSLIIDRFSCRVSIVVAGILFTIGCLETALAPSIEFAIITRGVIAGLGGAVGYTANIMIIGFYFRKRRNLAVGLSNSGIGVGICLLAPSMQDIYDFYGSVGFSIIMAGIFAQMIVFGMVAFPSKLELHAQRQRQREQQMSTNAKSCFNVCRRYIQVLKNKSMICLCAGMFSYSLGLYVVYLHLPGYMISNGFSSSEAANLVSLSGVLTVIARVITGAVTNLNCTNINKIYCLSMFIVGVSTFIFTFTSGSFAGTLVFSILLGSFFGNAYMLVMLVSMKYVDVVNLSMALGLEYSFGGLGTLLGPVFAGALVDLGGTYDQAFYVSAFCMFFAGVLSGAATLFSQSNALDLGRTTEVTDASTLKESEML